MNHSNPHDALARIGFNSLVARGLPTQPPADALLARVIEHHGAHSSVSTGRDTFLARPIPQLARQQPLVVGDWVYVDTSNAAPAARTAGAWVVARAVPYSALQRIEPSGDRQALVHNVDCAFLVMGLDGDFNPRRLERYLALAHGGGVFALVVLTKADLCANVEAHLEELAQRLPASIERHALDATDANAVQCLKRYLDGGQTGVLLGSSGAGKSTLINSLATEELQATAPVRADDSRGRHTTTSRQLVALPWGACLIDTPGLRGLRLDVDDAALAMAFEDIVALAPDCRYRDCRHESEPGCAVRARIDPDRLANFHKLLREAEQRRGDPRAQQQRKARAKALERAYRALQKDRGR
jgi:ribosome biogenesis GTPase / thiamine phosphate phosphatase